MIPILNSIVGACLSCSKSEGPGTSPRCAPSRVISASGSTSRKKNGYSILSLSSPVFAAPTEASQLIGRNGEAVFVKWPFNEVDGFVEIIWGGHGIKAWIYKMSCDPGTRS